MKYKELEMFKDLDMTEAEIKEIFKSLQPLVKRLRKNSKKEHP